MRLRLLLLALALLLAAPPPAPVVAQGEPVWARLLRPLLERQVPGLRLEGLGGTLTRDPTARRITVSDAEGVWLELEEVELVIDRLALLRGRARLERLAAARGAIARLPRGRDDAPPPEVPQDTQGLLPALPDIGLGVRLERIELGRFAIGAPVIGVPAAVSATGRLALEDGRLEADFDLRRLDAPGTFRLALALDPPADSLRAEADLDEPPGGLLATAVGRPGLPARLALRLDGPASGARLALDAALGPEVALNLAGTVRAAPGGAVGASGLEGGAALGPLLPENLRALSPLRLALEDAALAPDQTLSLRGLRLALPVGEAAVEGRVGLGASQALDLGFRLALGGSEPFRGLLPDLVAWRGLTAEGRLGGTVPAPTLRAEAAAEGFGSARPELAALLGPAPRLSVAGSADGAVERLALEGRALRLRASGRVLEPLDARATLDLFGLDALGEGYEGALRAEATATGAFAAPDVTLRAEAGRASLAGLASVEGLSLEASTSGPLDAPSVAFRAEAARLAAGGQRVEGLRAEGQSSGPRADPTISLRANAERAVLGGEAVRAPSLEARVATPFSAPAAEARVAAAYAGLPVTLDLLGANEGSRLRLERAEAGFGPARLSARGVLDPQAATFAGRAELDAPDLAPVGRALGQDLAGRLRASAELTDANGVQGFDARVEAPNLRAAGQAIQRLRATARGTVADAAFALAGQVGPATLDLAGRQREVEDGRRVELATLGASANGERVRLAAPARVLLRRDGATVIESLALAPARGPGRLEVTGRAGPDTVDLSANIANLPVAPLLALAGQEARARGALSGALRATGPLAAPEWRADLRAAGLRSTEAWGARLPAAEIRLEGNGAGARRAELRAAATAGAALRLEATARLPEGLGAGAPLAATLSGGGDLAPLTAPFLAGGANRVTGRVNLALRAGGTVGAPRLAGEATLANGSFRNADQGVRLTDIAARVTGEGERLVVRRLAAQTPGGGTLVAEGTISPAAPGLPVELAVTARNARPVQGDYGTALLDADLRLAGRALEDARLSGNVLVRRADIRVPEKLPANVRTIPDVRERGRGAPPPRAAAAPPSGGTGLPALALDVTVDAPRAVFVRGRGLDAELGGRLAVGGTLAAPAPRGAFALRRGTLDVLDRQIAFRRGAVTFDQGTLTPSLDFLAESRVRGATLQVIVEGSAADPEIRFDSTPPLPQDEILARLLFDRSLTELSPFQIAAIAQAAAGAVGVETGGGAGGVLDRVRRALALDRLAVGSAREDERTTTNNSALGGTTLEGGRYVADGVYVGVRQGVAGGPPRVGVQIDLLPRVRLEAETAGNSRAGDRVGIVFEREY